MSLILRARKGDKDDDQSKNNDKEGDSANSPSNDPMDVEKPQPSVETPATEASSSSPATAQPTPQGHLLSGEPNTQSSNMSADEVRARRLAALSRMGGNPPSEPSAPKPVSSPTSTTTPIAIKAPQKLQVPEKETRNVSTSASPTSSAFLSASPGVSKPSVLSGSPSVKPGVSPTAQASPLSLQSWENNTIQSVMKITFLPTTSRGVIFLDKLASELKQDGYNLTDIKLRPHLESIFLAIIALERLPDPYKSLLDYFLHCNRELQLELRRTSNTSDEQKMSLLQQIHQSIVSYAGLTLQLPNMFPSNLHIEEPGPKQFISLLEADPVGSELPLLPSEFIDRLVERFQEDGLLEIFEPVFEELSAQMLSTFLMGNFLPPMRALGLLLRNKALVNVFVSSSRWVPNRRGNGKELESFSLLGPFFRMTTLELLQGAERFFVEAYRPEKLKEVLEVFRTKLHTSVKGVKELTLTLLKASPKSKERVLDWFSSTLTRNREKLKMNVDPIQVCSDGFMVNVSTVLLHLCDPFLKISTKKYESIDPAYVNKSSARFRAQKDDTRFHLEKESLAKLIEELDHNEGNKMDVEGESKGPNFITESFFAAANAIHLGLSKMLANYEYQMSRFTDEKWRVLYTAQLLDPELIDLLFRYFSLMAQWFTWVALDRKAERPSSLPLPTPAPKDFVALPEYLLEDMIEFFIFFVNHPDLIPETMSFEEIVTFATMVIASPEYIRNPFLRGKLEEILAFLAPKQLKKPLRLSPFDCNDFVQKHLGGAIMQFFIDVERTGASNQFFEKFSLRFYCGMLISHLWKLPAHIPGFSRECNNGPKFLSFTNMMMNDSIYLLDESLAKLHHIHENEEAFASPQYSLWQTTPLNVRQEREQEHAQTEKAVRTYLLLSRESVKMLKYMTKSQAKLFTRPEIIERLAAMLNYFLVRLAGPKYQELKVKNPEKYNFQPRWLLKKIATTYLNFVNFPEFPAAVAADGRSYDPEVFKDAASVLLRTKLIDEVTHKKFLDFIEAVREKADESKVVEEELGDIPDEFLDPIMSSLMVDPVLLPSSGLTCDRTTITRHLLTTPSDPFNRKPLKIEDLKPNVELKAKIQDFIKSKKKKA